MSSLSLKGVLKRLEIRSEIIGLVQVITQRGFKETRDSYCHHWIGPGTMITQRGFKETRDSYWYYDLRGLSTWSPKGGLKRLEIRIEVILNLLAYSHFRLVLASFPSNLFLERTPQIRGHGSWGSNEPSCEPWEPRQWRVYGIVDIQAIETEDPFMIGFWVTWALHKCELCWQTDILRWPLENVPRVTGGKE